MRKLSFYIIVVLFTTVFLFIILGGLWIWLDPQNRDSPIILTGNYVYVDDDICMTDDDGSLRLVIPDDVCNYMFDENYIIVYQRPSFIRADFFWTFDNMVDKDSIKSLKNLCYRLKECYWIINVQSNSVMGPMDKNTFNYKCSFMGVKLKFDTE